MCYRHRVVPGWSEGLNMRDREKAEARRQEYPGRNSAWAALRTEAETASHRWTKTEMERESWLMETVCQRGNLMLAYQRVVESKGAAGIDS